MLPGGKNDSHKRFDSLSIVLPHANLNGEIEVAQPVNRIKESLAGIEKEF